MYYNEIQKQNFIEDYTRRRIVAETSLSGMFNKIAAYEHLLGKDCCDFNKSEILEIYKGFNAKSTSVLLNYNVYLKSYCAFCIYNNWSKYNFYSNLSKDEIKNCINIDTKNEKYITREQFDEIQDQLLNYTDKAILECLWQGISGASMMDLVSINKDMVNFDKQLITFKDGRKHRITNRLCDYLQKAFDETEYICYGDTMKVKKLFGVNCLYKERDNAYAMSSNDKYFRWVYRKVKAIRDYVDLPMLTMKNITASGMLDLIKEGMTNTGLCFRDFLKTECGREIAIQYGYTTSTYVDVVNTKFDDVLE